VTEWTEEKFSMTVASLQVDAQRLLLTSKPGSAEKRLAAEVLAAVAEWKQAKGLTEYYRPDDAPPEPDDEP
jgi:hypothetical protein